MKAFVKEIVPNEYGCIVTVLYVNGEKDILKQYQVAELTRAILTDIAKGEAQKLDALAVAKTKIDLQPGDELDLN